MRYYLLLALALSACCNSKEAMVRKLINESGSTEYILKLDTVYTPHILVDTIIKQAWFRDTLKRTDTIIYNTKSVEVRVIKQDSVVKVEADCKPQEVIVEKEIVKVQQAKVNWVAWMIAAVGIVWALSITYFYFRKNG